MEDMEADLTVGNPEFPSGALYQQTLFQYGHICLIRKGRPSRRSGVDARRLYYGGPRGHSATLGSYLYRADAGQHGHPAPL